MRKIFLIIYLVLTFSACSRGERAAKTPARAASPTPVASPPPVEEARDDVTPASGAGVFDKYKFTYKRAGDEVEAQFRPVRLPRVDSVVVGAAREVIGVAYGDRPETFPRVAAWTHEGKAVSAIKLEGKRHEFVIVPVRKGESGEIETIIFRRLAKGTLR